jgi:drug/metabolite transporter (DMT)-like permease
VPVVSALLALLSSAVWGTCDFLAGVTARRMPVVVVAGWSQVLSFAAITLVTLVWGRTLPADGSVVGWAVLSAVTGTGGLLCFYAALASGTMGVVAPISSVGSSVSVLLGVLTGDQPAALAWAGIGVALTGVVLASGPELSGGVRVRPVVLAAVAAVLLGVALFAIDRGARVSLLHTLWVMRLTSVVGYLGLALAARSVGPVGRQDLPVLAAIGLGDLTANGLFGAASTMGMVSVASVLGSLYPVATILLAHFLLHERLRRVQYAGVTLAMVGSGLIAAGAGG